MNIAIPPFERDRLLEIERLRLRLRPADLDIEDLLEICRSLTNSESCIFNLITGSKQIEKFVSGRSLGNIKREDSFCQYVINQNRPLFVEDARKDDRFKTNRYVVGRPKIRAYAGMPIHGANNLPVGALCIIDSKPRTFDKATHQVLLRAARMLRRRLIPSVSAELTEGLPPSISKSHAFLEKFNQLLCLSRQEKKSRTVLLYFQDSTFALGAQQDDPSSFYEVEQRLIERLAVIAEKNVPKFEGGILGLNQFALAINTPLPNKALIKLARAIVASLRMPTTTSAGIVTPKVFASVFIDDRTIHDPKEIIELCQFVQGYTRMSKPDVMFLTDFRVKQAKRLSVGRTRIFDAIKNHQITLLYQPIVASKGKKLNGFEALVRWNDKELGQFSALEVLELCDLEGLHETLDFAVLEMACLKAVARQKATGERVKMAVNIDVVTLNSQIFVRTFKKIIARTKFDPTLLEVELTEHSMINDTGNAIRKMSQLTDIGVTFVLDDFGTGYSSLTHLHDFPISKLKIDQSFVSKLDGDRASTLIQSIISTARLLGLETTGEGAETQEQLIALTVLGCTNIQGYGIARPLSVKNFMLPSATMLEAA